jgi:tetratricopeptide (TPR) repeat protein
MSLLSALRPHRLATAAVLLALPLAAAGCKSYTSGLKGQGTTSSGEAAAAATAATPFEQALEIWKNERGSKDGVEKAIAALEGVVAAEPNHQEAMILLARANYFLADAYHDDPAQKGPLFEKGVTWGERAMAADPEFKARLDKGEKPQDAVVALQKDDQMAIYWTATNLGKWARIQGFSTIVKYKGYIAKMMTHCSTLDESAFYAAPVRYWGAFYAVAPSFAGGDMNKSKENFEKAKSMAPEYFATYVLYADTYAVKAQDRALFKSLLDHVLATSSDVAPDVLPEQEAEKKKAQAMLAKIDELFAN